jgi:DNA-directed RNA polymerase subunit A"
MATKIKSILETKRRLSDEEIEDILTIISINKSIPKDVGISIRNNNAKKLRKQLENIMIYPKTIPHLKNEIQKQYIKTQIQAGESVGVITAQSIGERQTQLSVHSDEEIIVKYNNIIFEGKISKFIDELLEEESIDLIDHKNSKIRLVDNLEIYIQTVTEDEKITWQKINEVSRHPSNGRMVKVSTFSGREVTATLSHSFLKREKKEDGTYTIVPIEGKNLKEGDKIPIIRHSPFAPENHNDCYTDDIYNTKCFYDFIAYFLCSDDKKLNDDGTICIRIKKIYLSSYSNFTKSDNFYNKDCETKVNEDKSKSILLKCEKLYNFIKENMIREKEDMYKIPSFFYNIPKDKIKFLESFLETFYRLNGIENYENIGVYHKDKYITHQLACIYSFFGYSTSIFEKEYGWVLYFLKISDNHSSKYIFWDPIFNLEYTKTDKYVYDFSVSGNETFALKSGILVHNTLNSFHSAGLSIRTVVSGVPRFTELLNASKDPKNTSCQVFFKKDSNDSKDGNDNIEINQVRNKIEHSIVSLNLNNIKSEIKININKPREKWYNIFEKMFEKKENFDLTHCISVTISKEKMIEYSLTLAYISSKIEDEFKETHCIFSPEFIGKIDIFVDMTNVEESEKEIFLEDTCLPNITKYIFCGIKGITDIFYDKKGNEWYIDTEGSNLRSFFAHPNVDMTRTISTNVWDIYNTLGIEASRKFLIEQFINVISSDGTFVNNSHISLLVDIMTFSGMVVSISRYGLKKEACGPMAKASFEESLENFIKSGVFGETEKIIGVSASIIMGKQAKIGTGICDVLLDISNYVDNLNITDTKKIIKNVVERKISKNTKKLSNKTEKDEEVDDICDLYSDNEEDKDCNDIDEDIIDEIDDEDLEVKEDENEEDKEEDKEDLDIEEEEVDDIEVDCDDENIIDDILDDY